MDETPDSPAPPAPDRHPTSAPRALSRILAMFGSIGINYMQIMAESDLTRDEDFSARLESGARGTQDFARTVLKLAGLRARIVGPPPPPGALLIPNHISYIDVAVIASATPAFFVAKSEVGDWPVLGRMMLDSQHMIVKRAKTRGLIETARQMGERMRLGHRVCVFMEGTTTAGDRILPFMPSMFKPALELGAPIVPVGVRWRPAAPGISVMEDLAYWREAHTFVPHLWRLLGLPGFEGEIVFGEPQVFPRDADRREVADHMRAEVMRLTGLPAGEKEAG